MINVCEQLDHLRSAMFDSLTIERQFARVAKGVDLRSTAGNCAWVRTPQLTSLHTWVDRPTLFCAVDAFAGHW